MQNLYVVDHPLIKSNLTILRNKETNQHEFRLALERITTLLAFETCNNLDLKEFEIETPLEKTTGYRYSSDITLAVILRAGLSMVKPFQELLPDAKIGYIGLKRNEITLEPAGYYYKLPGNLEKSKVILLDPMLATGGSCLAALSYLKNNGAKDCIFVCLVAAPEGVEKINKNYPEVKIYTAALDTTLDKNGYILPGLGDAGDRVFGTI